MSDFLDVTAMGSGMNTPRMFGDSDLFGNNNPFGNTPGNLFGTEPKDYFSSNMQSSDFTSPMDFMKNNTPYPADNITPPHSANGTTPPDWHLNNLKHEAYEEFHSHPVPTTKTSAAETKNGQLTPPDDVVRAPSLDEIPESYSAAPKPLKRESTSSIKTTKSSKKSKKNRSISEESLEDEKRSKFLERNRVAASKCRQKKKEHNSNLEAKAKQLERENSMLKFELENLQQEKINLMTQMALHHEGECDCHQIHNHLASFKAQFSDPMAISARNPSIVSAPASAVESIE